MAKQDVVKNVALTVIDDLRGDRSDVVEMLLDAQRREQGGADHVYTEEAVDSELRDRGIRDRASYNRACGIVFEWLRRVHGIEPPTWFTRSRTAKRELCGRCMAALTETDREAGRCTQCGLLILKPAQTRCVGSSEADAVVRGRS